MTKLNKLHQQRWNNAKRLMTKMIECAESKGASIMYGESIIEPNQIKIDDTTIIIQMTPTMSYRYFEADPDYDHGLYQTCAQFKEDMHKDFTLVKKIKW